MRARPESITAVTPSIVTDDSATFVDRMILRRVARAHGARLILERHLAVQRQHRETADARQRRPAPPAARLISPAPGRNTSTSPSLSSRSTRRTAPATCAASGRSSGAGQVIDRDVEHAALAADDVAAQEVGDRIGVERRGHRDDAPDRDGRASRSRRSQRQREIGRDVALVKLVEHDGADAGQPRRGQHAAG